MWPVNLRVFPPKKLDLRVARKSTTSPLPGYVPAVIKLNAIFFKYVSNMNQPYK